MPGPVTLCRAAHLLPYSGTAHISLFGTTGGVYRSKAADTIWEKTDIRAMGNQDIVDFAADGSRLFAGLNHRSEFWLWSTEDFGITWDIRAHEFANLYTLAAVNRRMWAGRTDGLWSIDMSGWTKVKKNEPWLSGPALHQNYPNPFNPATEICYQLPMRAHVIMKVFDMLGRQVRVLVNEDQGAGTHLITFNAAGLPSGVYFYRLQAGTFVETKKLAVVK